MKIDKPAGRREALRDILNGDGCPEAGCVFDPISARVAQDAGMQLGFLAGSTASLVILGAPDVGVATLTEVVDLARRTCRAAEHMPIIVDAESGFGNALNTMRTVVELAEAGAAGVMIEDSVPAGSFPVPGELAGLVRVEEATGKLRSAVAARGESDVLLFARTNAMEVGTVEDAIARAQAYARCGVDAIVVGGRPTIEQLKQIAQAIKLPLMAVSASPSDHLARVGLRIVARGHLPFMAALQALVAANASQASEESEAPLVATKPVLEGISRAADYKKWTQDFTPSA